MLGDLIAAEMRKHNLKQKEVAPLAGMSPAWLSAALRNKRKLKAEELFALCTVMNVTPDYFFSPVQGK